VARSDVTWVTGASCVATIRPFIAFIRKQPGADFSVSFPDFPDCVAAGKTIAEAHKNAGRALALQYWRLCNAGMRIPAPSYMHDLYARRERTDGLVALIAPPDVAAAYQREAG
jgi:predicted RNase H-like HicB family nuclease